jgi:hypothetical protein
MWVRFCANLGKSATQTITMIQQAFRDQILSRMQVFQWHTSFKTGRTYVDDDEHAGRSPSCTTPETVARIKELICQDQRQTIQDIAKEVEIGYGTCQRDLMKELSIHRVAVKFVPRFLVVDQKQQMSTSALNFLSLPLTMKLSCPRSSPLKRAGFTVTTLRQSNNPPS